MTAVVLLSSFFPKFNKAESGGRANETTAALPERGIGGASNLDLQVTTPEEEGEKQEQQETRGVTAASAAAEKCTRNPGDLRTSCYLGYVIRCLQLVSTRASEFAG